jgi:hypothetical protein
MTLVEVLPLVDPDANEIGRLVRAGVERWVEAGQSAWPPAATNSTTTFRFSRTLSRKARLRNPSKEKVAAMSKLPALDDKMR